MRTLLTYSSRDFGASADTPSTTIFFQFLVWLSFSFSLSLSLVLFEMGFEKIRNKKIIIIIKIKIKTIRTLFSLKTQKHFGNLS